MRLLSENFKTFLKIKQSNSNKREIEFVKIKMTKSDKFKIY